MKQNEDDGGELSIITVCLLKNADFGFARHLAFQHVG
jgi:hypothetical protein